MIFPKFPIEEISDIATSVKDSLIIQAANKIAELEADPKVKRVVVKVDSTGSPIEYTDDHRLRINIQVEFK